MGKSTISMAIFNSYVKLPEGIWIGTFAVLQQFSMACEYRSQTLTRKWAPKIAHSDWNAHEGKQRENSKHDTKLKTLKETSAKQQPTGQKRTANEALAKPRRRKPRQAARRDKGHGRGASQP